MSGHSKWATIKRKKAATDQARGKVFSKYIKEITIAARHGGGDVEANPRLRAAIAAAKAVNMPAIEEAHYEGYGPGGAALLVEVATDNRNRTSGDVRHLFTKHGGKLGEAGSVAHMFKACGLIVVERSAAAEETLMEAALDAGADDVETGLESYEITTPMARLEAVKDALAARKIPVASAELTKLASLHVAVDGKEAEALLRLVDALEEHDDVQKVYSNFEISEELIARLTR